ncbi:MAG TPA: YicC/YloC family endoribonuclease [Candidatus Binatia bacterium]|nr:YicC/YloC family endoribonuclease [Candidatus Binatia bacterium]
MKSMTGYGEASGQLAGTKVSVQVRTLNHRHLDLQLRLPKEYLSFEEEIRKTIRQKITRGRIELFINRSAGKGQGRKVEVDDGLLGQYLACIRQAKKRYRLGGEMDVSLLTRFPDLFHTRDIQVDSAKEKLRLFTILKQALKKLEQSREREGRQLRGDMASQIRQLKKIAVRLEKLAASLGSRLTSTPYVQENASRAERNGVEAGGPVFKGDINEEVVRLQSHVSSLAGVLREREPVGKKIDFMLQEVQRELNTISSKLPQLAVVQLVLEGKERAEKIREQSQNVE